ncbi:MAG: vWA domain-containing protein [Baekduia sp.]
MRFAVTTAHRVRWLFAALALAALAIALLARSDESRAQATCVKPQKLGVVFVIDDSGSMLSNDPDKLRGSAVGVGVDQLPDGSVAAVTKFSTDASVISAPTLIDANGRNTIKQATAAGLASSGSTDYADGLAIAKTQLDLMTDADKKVVVFMSDGVPNSGFDAATAVPALGVPIYTVRFGTADATILQNMASLSGGTYSDAQSAGDLQAIFGRAVSSLTCDKSNVTESFTLAPGVTRTIPFVVSAGDGSFRALAAWSTGKVGVRAIRPDQSAMTPDALLTGEAFNSQPTYALLEGQLPAVGTWNLELTADASNAAATNVTIDVFKRGLAIKRPTGIQVFCNRAAQKGVAAPCTVTVGDAGPPPRQTPTGAVNFTATRGTPATASCQLQPTPLSPGVASCAIQYTPSDQDGIGVAFPVTAVYEGDGVFGPTTGVHKLINAACIEIGTTKCVSGVAIDLSGKGGTITSSNIPMTIGCAAGGQTQKDGPVTGDLCGVSVAVDADGKGMAKVLKGATTNVANSLKTLTSSVKNVATQVSQVLSGSASQNNATPVTPPATNDPNATPGAVTNKALRRGLDVSAAAKKKKRKVSFRLGTAQVLIAGGNKQAIKVPLTKRGKAVRTLMRKLKSKTVPAIVTVSFTVNGNKVTTVRQKVKLRIR